jgi:hypothetical protein
LIYWFGPFTPYFQAAFLRAFGPTFGSLALSGAVGAVFALAALHFALRTVTGRRESLLWTAVAVPTLVFMPNGGGSIIGMGYRIWHPATFALVAVALASRPRQGRSFARGAVVGCLCGFASLSRTEWGLMALAGSAVAFFLARQTPHTWVRKVLSAAVGYALIFGAGIGLFVVLAGLDPVLRDGHLLLTGISPETRRFLVAFSGVRDWPRGLAQAAYSASMWAGAVLLLWLASRGRRAFFDGRFVRIAVALGAVLVTTAFAGGASGAVLFSAAPLICLAAAGAGLARGRRGGAALATFGLVGFVSSHRRPFHIGDSAYVAPPLLFALVAAAGLLYVLTRSQRRGEDRRRLAFALNVGVAALVVFGFAGRILQYSHDERLPIPGTGGMLSAGAQTVRELVATAEAVQKYSAPGENLVVFPEGQVLNAVTGRRNPLRQTLYIPGYLTDENEPEILSELQATRPRVIVIFSRSTSEYGRAAFGSDYGLKILAWVEHRYEARSLGARTADRHVRLLVRK